MIECSECRHENGLPAECCQEVTINFDTEGDLMWWSELRWMVAHNKVSVARAKDTGVWSVIFTTECSKLTADGQCSIYKTRPLICKEYSRESCSKNGIGEIYDLEFDNLEDFDKWLSESVIPDLQHDIAAQEKNIENQLKDTWEQKALLAKWPHK
jgi:Fe-S-cluster containining protein